MAANIRRKIAEEDPAVIILYLMDNSVFFVRKEDGSRHVTNRSDMYYLEDMRQQLDRLRRHMKEFIYSSGMKNVKIYDPNSDLRDFTVKEIWGEDPVYTPLRWHWAEWRTGSPTWSR
jgi:hypothetical protein